MAILCLSVIAVAAYVVYYETRSLVAGLSFLVIGIAALVVS